MPAATSAGLEAVDLAASAGLILDPWQQAFLVDALGETPEGSWAAFEAGLIVPRQNGKGAILEALELAGLFLFGEQLILHSAHEFKTAAEAFRRVLGLIQSTPDLERLVKRVRTSHGDEGIELRSGQRLRFVARSTGSGRGFSGDRVILDEAYHLSPEAMAALLPTMSARPNPQIVYTSSAPLDADVSMVLRAFCRRGRAQAEGGEGGIVYHEYAADPADNAADPDVWAAANPGIPVRISVEHVARERAALTEETFARERLGVWDASEEGMGAGGFPAEHWAACRREGVGIEGPPRFGLDVPEDREWAAIGAAGTSTVDPEATAVEVVDARRGTGWVAARAAELIGRWGGELVVAKGSPAASLVEDLTEAGVPVRLVGSEDQAKACGQAFDAVTGHRWHHRGQGVLDVAVAGAGRRYMNDTWVWTRRRSSVDVSPLWAVTLAAGAPVPAPAEWDVVLA